MGEVKKVRHVLSILVKNQPRVLMRVTGMFSRRGFNIDSLAVGITERPEFSRITISMYGDSSIIKQVQKQLAKLVEVEGIDILPPDSMASRGMALIKVLAEEHRLEILQLAQIFRADVVDVGTNSLIFEITGSEDKLKAFADILKPYGILELVQTGLIALERGANYIKVDENKMVGR